MERVLGIGGVFIRARDRDALRSWYADALGIDLDEGAAKFVAEAGDETVWCLFRPEADYFPTTQPAMLNFRVRDLDAMLAQLREAGAVVDAEIEEYEYGRFGWFADPEGNRVELWEPRP